ncbi:endonuclease III [Desulfuromonas soudanensis]|nr:endonuclease III [Desulfuromonas soudanensis]
MVDKYPEGEASGEDMEVKRREDAARVLAVLEKTYPRAACALLYDTPLELLVATILSAQCTDLRVNQVTRELFRRYPDVRAYASADPEELEGTIRSTGFFRNKARNLIACAAALLERHDGEVPKTMEELTALPGVGRKTANVVLGNVFDVPGMVVDTHVRRVSRRLGWTKHRDPVKIEQDLSLLLPREKWTLASHLLIFHGRALCRAPVPTCSSCPLSGLCPRCGVVKAK